MDLIAALRNHKCYFPIYLGMPEYSLLLLKVAKKVNENDWQFTKKTLKKSEEMP